MMRRNARRLSIAFLLALTLIGPRLGSAQQPSTDDSQFKTFLADFQAAVSHKDRAKLEGMMKPSFDFFQAQHVPHATVFKHLDAEGGKQWANLQHAVQGHPIVVTKTYNNRPARVLQCTPTREIYHCYIVFQQDNTHQWRWKAMVMPQRH